MGGLVLEEPRWLWLLAAAPYIALVAMRSVTDASRRRRAGQAALRLLFLALGALVLAGPTVRRDETAVSAVVLLDGSASVNDGQLAEEVAFAEELRAAAARRTPAPSLRFVGFGAEPRELEGAGPLTARAAGARETDISLALGLGIGLLDPARVPRLVLLSDGRATRGNALAAAAPAAARGARIFVRQPGGQGAHDVAVLDLAAPDEIRPQASFDLEIRLLATHAGSARLRLLRDGQPHTPESEREITFTAGLTTVRWPTQLERSKVHVYRAALVRATDNGRPENDAGLLAVAPRARPRALVLETHAAAAAPFTRALAAEGFELDTRPPRALGASADPARYDLLVMADVGRGALSGAQQELLERHVREGGGLLVAGGPASFGSGGYLGTRLAGLLPVRQDPSDERTEATLALALVIDRSGSMSGPKMDLTKDAARGTAQMLSPEDLIAVIVFDSQAHPVVRLQPASNRQRILNDIAQIRASGGTNILPGLREAYDALVAARARKKHVILLSDGQSPYEGIPELVDDAAAGHITVSAVGVGEGADQTLLQMIASRGGGRFYHTRDPASIPQIFTRETAEVSRSSIVEAPTRLRAVRRAEMLAGLTLELAPPLRGYTRTRGRKEAEVLLATTEGDPLLARWQVGLGQVAAWTSDLASRWSADLSRWSQYPKLWAQVARGTMRRGAAHQFPLHAQLTGEEVTARIEALGSDDQPLAGLRGQLEVVAVSPADDTPGPPRKIDLVEESPGVYQAVFPLPGRGPLLLDATLGTGQGAPVAEAHGRLGLPLERELLPEVPGTLDARSAGAALLEALARRTGGGPATVEAVLDAGKDHVRTHRSLRVPLLLAALLVFLADLALRRARLRRS